MTEPTERCIGCGAIVARIDGPIHRYMTSAPGCWAKHGELSAYHLSDPGASDYRQLCADAYAVQHPGQPGPQATQSVGGHLVNLFAQLKVGLPVARAAAIIERGIRQKGYFAWLTPPSFEGAHTILFMLANLHDPRRAAHEWAASAWKAWAPHHAQVRAWYEDLSRGHGGS
jgi:Family of unknown function (DUF5946)